MTNDYTLIDDAIIDAVRAGERDLHSIRKVVEPVAAVGYVQQWNLVEVRLQALRKAGRIEYSRELLDTGWRVTREAA